MMIAQYLSTPGWSELVVEPVLGRPNKVWGERPRQVLDLLDLSVGNAQHDLLVQGERRVSFGMFRDALESGAAELVRLGVARGDKVLIVLYNSPEFLLSQWAAWRVGAVPECRGAPSSIVRGRLPRGDHAPALRRSAGRLDLLDLPTPRQELAGVAGREEDREAGHGMADECGRDAAGDRGDPAAGQPDEDRHHEHPAVPDLARSAHCR